MRIDLLHFLPNRDRRVPFSQLLDDSRRVAEDADELGFDGIWFGEHHFNVAGEDNLPNPIMLGADIAARTERVRIGMCAIVLPYWHPVRLAEDLAVLDQMSEGRLDTAFARGILTPEIQIMSPEADRKDEARSRAIFDENLQILRRAWSSDSFSWHGPRFDFPPAGVRWAGPAWEPYTGEDGFLTSLPLVPRPVQGPTPPMYAVTQAPGGMAESARQGVGVITSFAIGRKLAGLREVYDATPSDPLPGSETPAKRFAVVRDTFVADTDVSARNEVRDHEQARFDLICRVRGMQEWLDLDESPDDPSLQGRSGLDILDERHHLLVGSPETVIEKMVRLIEVDRVDHLLIPSLDIPLEKTRLSLRLLATEVLPEVRRRVGADVPTAPPA